MAQGLQVWDGTGAVMLDTTDRIAGNWVTISTGKSDGAYTMPKLAGQTVGFAYNMPASWSPAGTASPWPVIAASGDTVSWSFTPAAPAANRMAVTIYGFTY